MIRALLLALASGVPALVYEVVWTREVALLAGGQIEAISTVLVAFFGGLAIGARWLGPYADGLRRPLLYYAGLEALAGLLAVGSSFALRLLGSASFAGTSAGTLLAASCALLAPITILLGATVPALLRVATSDPRETGRVGGWLVGANTLGSVAGVAVAALAIPEIGLRATLLAAGGFALAVALVAAALARERGEASAAPARAARSVRPPRSPLDVLIAASILGVATLGYEVVATRAAMLGLGTSLYAWAIVLGLFLAGLAAGNLAFASWAARARNPAHVLGWIEIGAAAVVAGAVLWLVPTVATPAAGVVRPAVLVVVLAVIPAAVLMGAAFPFLVRLSEPGADHLAAAFSRVSAVNTAGGIAGAFLAPFALLPALGLTQSVLACAGLNACVAAWFLTRSAARRSVAALRLAGTLVIAIAAATVLRESRPPPGAAHVLSVEHGRQATSVVLQRQRDRTLVVDGETEAATRGGPLVTEEMLAVLPVLLHPEPHRLLEVGFGSGITLGTAARFPLDEIRAVEIADSVLRSARFFSADNGGVADGGDPRVEIVRGDGRAYLAQHPNAFDVVVANTLHPWSLGATGLYSREYFARIEQSLAVDGIAIQWLALEVGEDTFTTILRTILAAFPHGSLWWGADNLLVVARRTDAPEEVDTLRERAADPALASALADLDVGTAEDLAGRRIASFAAAREALGPGPLLLDDRPVLERQAADRSRADPSPALGVLARIAEVAAREDRELGAMRLWLESRVARAAGDAWRADRREALAEAEGLGVARAARLGRMLREAEAQLSEGRLQEAGAGFGRVLEEAPDDVAARFGLAAVAYESRDDARAAEILEALLAERPTNAEAWNLLGAVRLSRGDGMGAREAVARALDIDPYLPRALANAGLIAAYAGNRLDAERMLWRLDAISPLGVSVEEQALRKALAAARPGP